MTLPRIGVLGGMGPAATIQFQQRLLDATQVNSDDGHIPLLIDMNPQVPSRIDYLLHGCGQSPGPTLAKMAQGLERNGADVIVMPCCTAHYFADHIERSISVPFINMVQLSLQKIARITKKNSRLGVLASPAAAKTGLFERQLAQHDLTAHYPTDTDSMLKTIESIKKSGPCEADIEIVQCAVDEMTEQGIAAIFVGCTEFSLIAKQLNSELLIVDALDVLTQHITELSVSPNPGAR